ncbi:LPXTG cell wall anchor domain-containing protein [Nocardioides sp. WS12]|uniref:LPXTG cell wall anchor domain-containing protein n=1 Tax=Nocardioides sp. WS12 TaxID=2486272 RepID=UPI0015FA917F|nr:LPXTG cell wall anchor domain-containing protein [Nocardioides sp. WS12]
MTSSSRRLRRPLSRGGRLALVVPTALLAMTTLVSPSFADDVNPDDGGDTPAVVESEVPAAEPEPAPAPEPKPEPAPEPKPDPKPDPKPEPKSDDEATDEASDEATDEAESTPIEIPEDAVPVGEAADTGARLVAKVVALADENTKKMVVCKYSATPTYGEKAQTVVIRDLPGGVTLPVDWPLQFNDAQGASIATRHPLDGENSNEININTECPPYVPPGVIVPPVLTVNDPCGLNNAEYNDPPAGSYTFVRNPDGSLTLTATGNNVFPSPPPAPALPGTTTWTYAAPADSGILCSATVPDLGIEDPCGLDNAAYEAVPASDFYTSEVNEDGSVTLTAIDDYSFDGGPTYTYPAPVDSNELCRVIAPELDVNDPCGLDNAAYEEVPASDLYTSEVNEDGSVTLTAVADYGFDGEPTYTYPAPVDSNELCPVIAPELDVNDPCGLDNAAYEAVPENELYTSEVNEDGSVTLTAIADYGFDGEPTYTYPAPVDEGILCSATVPDLGTVDPCGLDNIAYEAVPANDFYTSEVNEDGSVTLTAIKDYAFDGKPTYTYPAPVDEGILCPAIAPELDVLNPCGVDNAAYEPVPANDLYTSEVNEDGSVTLTAIKDYGFDGEPTYTYPAPVDSNELCPVIAPELDVNDPCGLDNAAYETVPENELYTSEVNEDGSVTLTAIADYGFDGEPTYTYPAPVDSNEECPVVKAYVACSSPLVARTAPIAAGIIVVIDEVEAALKGFLGTFPYTYTDGTSEVTILQELAEGQDPSSLDAATLCGEVAVIVEEPPTVGGIVEVLPNTGGPAGWLVPLGTGLVLAGAALVLMRRRETV